MKDPKVTADTVTDEQIVTLRNEASSLIIHCQLALGRGIALRPAAAEVHAARARCAEILNARAKD